MGKRLIIKGADFSVNGMKAVTYMHRVYSNEKHDQGPTFMFIGSGLPLTSYNQLGTMEILADIENADTEFNIVKGNIASGGIRLLIKKPYKPGSIGEPTIDLGIQYGRGLTNGEATITPGETLIEVKQSSVKFNNVSTVWSQEPVHSEGVLTTVGLWSRTANTACSVKFKRITIKDANGVTLANYLPALDDNDNVALYDTISDTYIYPDANTGWVAD